MTARAQLIGLVVVASVSLLAASNRVSVVGQLGWEGHAVAGRVNPLWLEVENLTASPLSTQLRVHHRAGNEWRGEARRELILPLLLAPRGRITYHVAFPLDLGARHLVVEIGGEEVEARFDIPVNAVPQAIQLAVGPAAAVPGSAYPVRIEAAELPSDPLLLASVSALWVDPAVRLPAEAQAALLAWHLLLGGEKDGARTPVAAWPGAPVWEASLSETPLTRVPAGFAATGLLLYLTLGVMALGRWERTGRGAAVWTLAALALGLSWCSAGWWGTQEALVAHEWSITTHRVPRFELSWCGLFGRRGAGVELPGRWTDLLAPEDTLSGRDVRWVWGAEGWTTQLTIRAGDLRVLWGLQQLPDAKEPGTQAARFSSKTPDPPDTLPSALHPLWDAATLLAGCGGAVHATGVYDRREDSVWIRQDLYVTCDD